MAIARTFNEIQTTGARTFNELLLDDEISRWLMLAKHCSTVEEILKYNHFHGKDGRFVSVPEGIGLETEKAKELSSDMVAGIERVEPERTSLLNAVAREVDGEMTDLQFAVKTKESLNRKLCTDIEGKHITAKEAAREVYDVSRYTMLLKDSTFGEGYQRTVELMGKKGNELVRVKNTLADEDAPYRGLNCVFRSQDGSKFELQFHTAESHRVKALNHILYERQRDKDTPEHERIALGRQMNANARKIPTPTGAEKIKNMNKL